MANTQTSVPVFTVGQVLTAQQQTEINTGIPVFATEATRDAAFGGAGEKVLAEGQACYIEQAPDRLQVYNGTVFRDIFLAGFSSFTPVVTAGTGTFTTVSATSQFNIVGRLQVLRYQITITTNGTAGQEVRFTIPFAVQGAGGGSVGFGRDISVTGNMINVFNISSTVLACVTTANGYPGANGVILTGVTIAELA